MKQKRNIKISLILLTVIFMVSVLSISKVCIYSVLANDSVNKKSSNLTSSSNSNSNSSLTETTIELFDGKDSSKKPLKFEETNMFPGDSYTNYYKVKVNYHDDLTVYFNIDIEQGYEVLAKVLKVEIKINNESKYNGLMKDMPSSIEYNLSTPTSTLSELNYEIKVYLDTSVNNDYQNSSLKANFNWWIPETKSLDPSDNILWKVVDTGVGLDYIANNTSTYLMINIFLFILSLSLIIYLKSILHKYGKDGSK